MKRNAHHRFCVMTGLCTAVAMMISMSAISMAIRIMPCSRSLVADSGAKAGNPVPSEIKEITVNEPAEIEWEDAEKLNRTYNACKKAISSRRKKKKKSTAAASEAEITVREEEMTSTTATTTAPSEEHTTVTTTMPSQSATTAMTMPTTEAGNHDEASRSVSNGQKPFNYNDVSSIAAEMETLSDFVRKVSPTSIGWNTDEYNEKGCVRITLTSEYGYAVLDVKPVTAGSDPYLIDGEKSGSVSGSNVSDWQWYIDNKEAGCNISSVVWTSADFGIKPVRNVTIGSTLAALTDHYLCVNGGATTLYKASDVIKDQNKLNAILSDENIYTFVGGRVYSIGSYLDKYYHGKEHTFLFEDCDYIVQYGCNSIMEHNYTTGSWIIEYAVKEDIVTGISFMNKSYYKNASKPIVSTNNSSSASESGMTTAHTEAAAVMSEEPAVMSSEDVDELPEEASDGAPENPDDE